ncbi:peptidylprolyl isomerase [Candidatus Sumerlaeota bacterium]|nr:peptidylprolyl isomerase [Candidatus Sumerlaeota bacterium]
MKKRSILTLMALMSVTAISMTPMTALAQPGKNPAEGVVAVATPSPEPSPVPLKATDPMVKINGEELTTEQFTALVVLRPTQGERINPMIEVPLMRGERIEAFALNVGAYDVLAAEAKEKGIVLEERENGAVENMMKNWRNYLLSKNVLLDKMGEPTKEDLDKIYEENKDKAFKVKESLRLRQIFVSTYVDYTVKAGDSLESIAREIGGDEKLADQILDDTTKRPRADKKLPVEPEANPANPNAVLKKAEGTLDPRALQEGEKLKVPVHGEKEADAKAKIDKAYNDLVAGETFETVARGVSENENPGQIFEILPESGDRPIMPELKQAFMALGDKEFSKPIRTRHGFSIIYRESYRPAGSTSREEAEPRLKGMWEGARRTTLIEEFFASVAKDPEITHIMKDKLKDVKGTDGESIIFVKIGDKEFALSQFSEATQDAIRNDKDDSVELVANALAKEQAVQEALAMAYIAKAKYDDFPFMKFVKEKEVNTELGRKLIMKEIEEKTKDFSEEEQKKFYDENKENLRVPASYELYKIDSKLDAETLAKDIKGIQNVEDFKTKANELAPVKAGEQPNGGALGKVGINAVLPAEQEMIKSITAPGMSKVIAKEGGSHVYWLQSVEAERQKTFEESKEGILDSLRRRKRVEINNTRMAEAKAKVNVEVLAN